jgi:hypothetical protein
MVSVGRACSLRGVGVKQARRRTCGMISSSLMHATSTSITFSRMSGDWSSLRHDTTRRMHGQVSG